MTPIDATSEELIFLHGYKAIQWVFFALCLLAFLVRTYIRYICFRRLLFEDWLMVLALACHLGVAVTGQLFLADMYAIIAVEHGAPVTAEFLANSLRGVKAVGVISVLSLAGIWLIKLNFLFFFYRLGNQIRAYRIFWIVVFVFSIGCGGACFGLLQYPCMFGQFETVFIQCATPEMSRASYIHVVLTAVLDILSDFAILCFPFFILWNVKVGLRKKLVLSAVFGLVGVTIAVTIVRASVFSPQFESINGGSGEEVNMTWITFWFIVEFTVSYVVACIVSFRTLFVHKGNQSSAKQQKQRWQNPEDRVQRKKSLLKRLHGLHDSVMDTCRTWEGDWADSDTSLIRTFRLPTPPTARLSVDFSRDGGDSLSHKRTKSSGSEPEVSV